MSDASWNDRWNHLWTELLEAHVVHNHVNDIAKTILASDICLPVGSMVQRNLMQSQSHFSGVFVAVLHAMLAKLLCSGEDDRAHPGIAYRYDLV